MAAPAAQRRIRFLFVGDPRFDRRVRNFIALFERHGWDIELFYCSTKPTEGTPDGVSRLVHITPSAPAGVRFFYSYHHSLLCALRSSPRVDVTFVTDLFGMRAAQRTKHANEILIYDAREVYTQLPSVDGHPLKQAFWKWWERSALRHTDLMLTTAPMDADAIRAVHGFLPPNVVVKNVPSVHDLHDGTSDLRGHFKIAAEHSLLAYVGGLQQGRGLLTAVSALTQLPDAELVLIGTGAFESEVRAASVRIGVADRVHFYGSAHADDVLPLLRSADVGISLIERSSGSYRLALPSKIFEYLHAGLPVVSSPLEQVQRCIETSEAVFYADENDLMAVVATIAKAISASKDTERRHETAASSKAKYTFESDVEPFYATVTDLLTRSIGAS